MWSEVTSCGRLETITAVVPACHEEVQETYKNDTLMQDIIAKWSMQVVGLIIPLHKIQ